MEEFKASYFDGESSKKTLCTLQIRDFYIYVVEKDLKLYLDDIKISSKIKGISQTITLKNGGYYVLNPNDSIKQNYVTKLESKYIYSVISILIMAGIVAFFLTTGSSWSAKIIANALPQDILNNVSKQALKHIEDGYLKPTNLSKEKQEFITKEFEKIAPKDLNLKLHFFRSPILKENAFALPSGDIIILDDMVLLDKDKHLRGTLGVLAHEIGHVKKRHSMQNLIKTSIAGAVVGYFIGDFSYLMTALVTGVVNLTYSREFEEEADNEAISLMKQHNISLKPLIDVFETLEKKFNNKNSVFLNTHPLFKQRIANFKSEL